MQSPELTQFSTTAAPQLRGRAEAAYEAIARLILEGTLRPGELILEAPLARQLKISRTPLREALGRLEGEALLMRDAGRRLSVRSYGLEDLLETLHLRMVLEPETVRLATPRIEEEVLNDLRVRIHRLLTGVPVPPEEPRKVDVELHQAIARASGNKLIAQILAEQNKKMALFSIRHLPERVHPVCEEHLALIDALLARDVDRAVAAMNAHLIAVRQSIIDRLTRPGHG